MGHEEDDKKAAYCHGSPVPFGWESCWDLYDALNAFTEFFTSPVPFGWESCWDPTQYPERINLLIMKSPVPFGWESCWDKTRLVQIF